MSDVVAAVRSATEGAPKRARLTTFSMTSAGPAERMIAPLVGIYLGFAVVRLHEVFPILAIPRLPMVMMLAFLLALALAVPSTAWKEIWHRSLPFRLTMYLAGIAVAVSPFGIWPKGSLDAIENRYVICITVFLSCLVFLRDRKNLRRAVMLYVLCVAAVSADVVITYDPNAIVYNDDGDPIDPAIVAATPDLHRLRAVGASLDPNDFGAVLCTAFPLAIWLSVGNMRRRVFWGAVALLLVGAVVPTQSRGSELGFVASTAVLLSIGARGWRRFLSFGMVAAGTGVFVMMATGLGAAGRFTDFSQQDYNLNGSDGRWYFWKQGLVWMLKRPWGYGMENYPLYFGMLNGPERASHSTWVQYGMELGVAALVTFIALCRSLVQGLRALRQRAAAWVAGAAVAKDEDILAGHMLALLTGVLVTGSFLANAYYPLLYMSLGLAAGVLLGSPVPGTNLPVSQQPAGQPRLQHGRNMPHRRMRTFPGSPAAR